MKRERRLNKLKMKNYSYKSDKRGIQLWKWVKFTIASNAINSSWSFISEFCQITAGLFSEMVLAN